MACAYVAGGYATGTGAGLLARLAAFAGAWVAGDVLLCTRRVGRVLRLGMARLILAHPLTRRECGVSFVAQRPVCDGRRRTWVGHGWFLQSDSRVGWTVGIAVRPSRNTWGRVHGCGLVEHYVCGLSHARGVALRYASRVCSCTGRRVRVRHTTRILHRAADQTRAPCVQPCLLPVL